MCLEIIYDGIGLWARPGTKRYKQPGEATALFQLVVSAYALLTRTAYEVTTDGWIEATDAGFETTYVGFRTDHPRAAAKVDAGSDASRAMRAAAELAVAVVDLPLYRLAIRDIYSALRAPNDDAFFFAYRAIEDVARAVSGQEGQLQGSDWAAFHRLYDVEADEGQKNMEPLTRARKAAAHGGAGDPDLFDVRRRRGELIDLARVMLIRGLNLASEVPVEGLPVVFASTNE